MKTYIPKHVEVKAEKFQGHEKPFELREIKSLEGTSGYQKKLGYIEMDDNRTVMVRPNDWVVETPDGEIQIMTEKEFLEKWVEKPSKSVNTKKAGSPVKEKDNVQVI